MATFSLAIANGKPVISEHFGSIKPAAAGLEAQQRYFSYRAIPVAIVSQNVFVLVFLWGIAQLSRDTLQNGVSHRCACVKLSTKGGIAPFWGSANLLEKVSRDVGYRSDGMGSQHPSPNVKTFCNFEPQIWLEIITSRDAKSACFKGSRTPCREIIFGIFLPKFGQKRSHHVMDASYR